MEGTHWLGVACRWWNQGHTRFLLSALSTRRAATTALPAVRHLYGMAPGPASLTEYLLCVRRSGGDFGGAEMMGSHAFCLLLCSFCLSVLFMGRECVQVSWLSFFQPQCF